MDRFGEIEVSWMEKRKVRLIMFVCNIKNLLEGWIKF